MGALEAALSHVADLFLFSGCMCRHGRLGTRVPLRCLAPGVFSFII